MGGRPLIIPHRLMAMALSQASYPPMLPRGKAGVRSLPVNCKSTAIQSISKVSLKRGGVYSHARKEFKYLSATSCNLLAWASIYTLAASYLSPWTLQETRGGKPWHLSGLNRCFRQNFLSWVVSAFHSMAVWGFLLCDVSFPTTQTIGKHSALMIMNSRSLCDIIIHYTVMIYYFPPV